MYTTAGSLEVKLPTMWTEGKAEVGRVREEKKRRREKIREEKESEERRCRRAKRSERLCFSTGSGGSKSRLAKAAGVEPPGQMRDEKVLAVVARSTDGSEKNIFEGSDVVLRGRRKGFCTLPKVSKT